MERRNRFLTAAVGLGVLAVTLHRVLAAHEQAFWLSVLFLGALAAVSESLGSELHGRGRTTYGIVPLVAAVFSLNTLSAVLVALFAAFSLQDLKRRRSPWALAFNGLQYALSLTFASFLYHALGGASRAFELGETLRSVPVLMLAVAAFWAVNTALVSLAVHWEHGVSPLDFLRRDALRMLPNQLFYGLLGMALGVIYAQNAFHLVALEDGGFAVTGTPGEALRGFAASLMYLAMLGVAWSFSRRNIELLKAYDRATERLIYHLEEREPYLKGHAPRVAAYSDLLAARLGMSPYDRRKLRYAALLHDLGKAAVPREILLQREALSEEEFRRVQQHSLTGSNWLEEIPYLADAAGAVLHHHEYYDGGGYPDGIAGDTIPLVARVLAVADAYEAMLNPRPWREAKSPEAAAAELQQNAGVQFDPELVRMFLGALQASQERAASSAGEAADGGEREEVGWQPEEREQPRRPRKPGKRRRLMLEERRRRREMALAPREVAAAGEETPLPAGNGGEASEDSVPSSSGEGKSGSDLLGDNGGEVI